MNEISKRDTFVYLIFPILSVLIAFVVWKKIEKHID